MFSLSEPTVLSVFLFSYSSLASLVVEESLYTSALPIARFASLFSPYFSNLPEIVLFLSRDRLCRRCPSLLPPPAADDRLSRPLVHTVYSSRRSEYSSVLIFSGTLFCLPYLPALLEPRLIRKHTPSLLPRFSRFLFFDLCAGFLAFTSYSLSLQSSTF